MEYIKESLQLKNIIGALSFVGLLFGFMAVPEIIIKLLGL